MLTGCLSSRPSGCSGHAASTRRRKLCYAITISGSHRTDPLFPSVTQQSVGHIAFTHDALPNIAAAASVCRRNALSAKLPSLRDIIPTVQHIDAKDNTIAGDTGVQLKYQNRKALARCRTDRFSTESSTNTETTCCCYLFTVSNSVLLLSRPRLCLVRYCRTRIAEYVLIFPRVMLNLAYDLDR